MKVALLGLEFANSNMGCQALAYSFTSFFSKVVKKQNMTVEYHAIVFKDIPKTGKKLLADPIFEHVIKFKSLSFWKGVSRLFKQCDLIVDFSGGDSFSDIYGAKRFLLASSLKITAIKSGTPFLLGPQTYGPYSQASNKTIARWILKKSRWVFSRDDVSSRYVKEIAGIDAINSTDVAFTLPYDKVKIQQNSRIKVGINCSGLLWNGGYSFAKLPMKTDYRTYCENIIEKLIKANKYEIYLIPHVGLPDEDNNESDYYVSKLLHEKYPETILVKDYLTPMDLKGFISAMDVFIGARMHATIASFSSGVATIPFSYSRKFEGLFGSVGYKNVISARSISTEEAVSETMRMIGEYQILSMEVASGMMKINDMICELEHNFESVIQTVLTEKRKRLCRQ